LIGGKAAPALPGDTAAMRRLLAAVPLLLLAGCATQPAAHPGAPGFFAGFLHGLTALFALAASLFMDVRIYAFPNAGFSYDLGFVAGFVLFLVLVTLSVMARIGGLLTR
jgi:hypothetical protein